MSPAPTHDGPEADDVQGAALPLEYEEDLDPLLDRIGDARCVLIGEASHGTHEYYAWRAALTRRLIAERGSRSSRSRATIRTAAASAAR